ncbi:MAG: glucose-1-phosphate thymidylyltransferase RfbA [Rhodospirillales bacterium]|nr:glucose-1-phosphate thymidylyltransferase RfbA [Alphaproteobacteria bacterium]MCB9986834.1 glucose-1-phosphate thymidylyltransferase RfbA [Rhodospirillales bacterium]USO08402.1 MAG: glucose-1-phosphate thymidylyltransferase RfbA [Rhodospirillales bacterium]
MKGIILAGGHGTRLHPVTRAVSKHLLPVYNKPMIYYPLATLMLAGIRDILIITKPEDRPAFERLLATGAEWGLRIAYAAQSEPKGIAEAVTIGADFIDGERFVLILGDNIFFGAGLGERLRHACENNRGATVFAHHVRNPEAYGVVAFDAAGKPLSIEEKPKNPQSHWALTGLYVYEPDAIERARALRPSPRGELEITDLNRAYLDAGKLNLERLTRGYCWMDMGTPENLLAASDYVRTIEDRQGLRVCDPNEVARLNGWV